MNLIPDTTTLAQNHMIPSDKELIELYHNTKGMRQLRIAQSKNGVGVFVFHVEQEYVGWFGLFNSWHKVERRIGIDSDEFATLEDAEKFMIEIIINRLQRVRKPHAYHMYVS